MKHLLPGFLQKTLQLGLLIVLNSAFLYVKAQTTVFAEDFSQWTAQSPSLPQGWLLGGASCNVGPSCFWSEPSTFPPATHPDPFGCDGRGIYALGHSSGLAMGDRASMISPSIDLGNSANVSQTKLNLCVINPSSNGLGTDQLEILFSIDGGQNWQSQIVDGNIYTDWTQLSLNIPNNMWVNNFRIRIDAIGGSDQLDMGVDELEIVQYLSTCNSGPSVVNSSITGQVCKNHEVDITILTTNDSSGGDYSYILTDALDLILGVLPASQVDLNFLPPNDYRIYGISYTGNLTATTGLPIQTASASVCHTLSSNFESFFVTELVVNWQLSDYKGFEVSIAGGQDGKIEILAPAGSSYAYNWSHDSNLTGPVANQLGAGTYVVLVIDQVTGCTNELNISLNSPSPLVGTLETTTEYNGWPVSCFDANDGALKASIRGGVRPYRYAWQGAPGFGDSVLTNIPAGSYALNVIDDNGALIRLQRDLIGPEEIQLQNGIELFVCKGGTSQEISLELRGGTGLYTYLWSNGSTDSTINNLSPGEISIQITDENSCSKSFELEVKEAPELVIDPIVMGPQCPKQNTGSILLFASGGISPYNFNWSNGSNEEDLLNLAAGSYTVTLEDSLGCELEESFELKDPEPLAYNLELIPDNGRGNGAAKIQVEGGIEPYTYEWSTGETGKEVFNLRGGAYSVTIIDAAGCSQLIPFEIELPQRPNCLDIHMGFSPNGDGYNDKFVIPCLDFFPDNELQILNRWGQELFYQVGYDNSWEGTSNGKALAEGTYFYIVHINTAEGRSTYKGSVSIIK
ncbi:MAG: gliding motility-associated C-terminal domain-containing protein [Bacteroidota bacterium]